MDDLNNTPNKYGRYFLAFEADDRASVDPDVKFNTKIITVKPTNRHSKLYTIGDDYIGVGIDDGSQQSDSLDDISNTEIQTDEPESSDTNEIPDDTDSTNAPNDSIDTNTQPDLSNNDPIVSQDGNEIQPQDDLNGPAIDNDPLVQQVNATNAEIDNNGNPPDVTTPTIDNQDPNTEVNMDEPITDDSIAVDDTMDSDRDGIPDSQEDPNQQTGAIPEQKRGPGIEYDSTRKYVLFQKYVELCNAIADYTERLDSITNDSYNTNQLIKIASNKLTEVYNVTYDYLTMKFELASYVQSLLFYQERIATVYKIFDLIKSSKETITKKE